MTIPCPCARRAKLRRGGPWGVGTCKLRLRWGAVSQKPQHALKGGLAGWGLGCDGACVLWAGSRADRSGGLGVFHQPG